MRFTTTLLTAVAVEMQKGRDLIVVMFQTRWWTTVLSQHGFRLRGVQSLSNGCFAVFAFQLVTFTKYLNEVFLPYSLRFLSQYRVHQQGTTYLSHDGLKPARVPDRRVNNPTLWDFCVSMIGRADIEGSKSNVAMSA